MLTHPINSRLVTGYVLYRSGPLSEQRRNVALARLKKKLQPFSCTAMLGRGPCDRVNFASHAQVRVFEKDPPAPGAPNIVSSLHKLFTGQHTTWALSKFICRHTFLAIFFYSYLTVR
jgi:hypothetical protein